jgi:hypothetical protein
MQNDGEIWGRARRGVPENWPVNGGGQREEPAQAAHLPEGPVADMTRNMLEAYGIPVLEIYRMDGGFARVLFGASAYGVELFVPASRQEEARALLAGVPENGEDTASGEPGRQE